MGSGAAALRVATQGPFPPVPRPSTSSPIVQLAGERGRSQAPSTARAARLDHRPLAASETPSHFNCACALQAHLSGRLPLMARLALASTRCMPQLRARCQSETEGMSHAYRAMISVCLAQRVA
jgi:hypothetical protein